MPGLMIWTLVCFLIAFFVLKRYAFGPIQKMIDERRERIRAGDRGGRQRPRRGPQAARGAPRADRAGARARPRRSSPRRGAVADAQRERVKRGDRGRPPAPARGDAPPDRGRDAPRARADPGRGRRPRRSIAASKVAGKVARPTRPAAADRRGDRGARLLGAGGRAELVAVVSPHLRPGALRRRARTRGGSTRSASDLDDFVEAVERRAGARGVAREPASSTRGRRRAALDDPRRRRDPLVRNFAAAARREGPRRRGRARSRASSSASSPREQGRLAVELTTAFELSDDEARAIVDQIEKASGRKVEATRERRPRPDRRASSSRPARCAWTRASAAGSNDSAANSQPTRS